MKKFLVVLALVLLIVVVVGAVLPTDYSIERSIDIQAPPARVHAHVGDLEQWPSWTPWLEQDPTIQVTLGDTTTGVGASQTWTGDSGNGELTFTKCDPATGVAYDMAFIMGEVRAPSVGALTYRPSGASTTVVWSMRGDVGDFMPPVVGGYMNLMMKSSIAGMFDQGLSKLKTVVESAPAPAAGSEG